MPFEPANIPVKAYIGTTLTVNYQFSGSPTVSDFSDIEFEVPGLVTVPEGDDIVIDAGNNTLSVIVDDTVMAQANPCAYHYRLWVSVDNGRYPIIHGEFAVEIP